MKTKIPPYPCHNLKRQHAIERPGWGPAHHMHNVKTLEPIQLKWLPDAIPTGKSLVGDGELSMLFHLWQSQTRKNIIVLCGNCAKELVNLICTHLEYCSTLITALPKYQGFCGASGILRLEGVLLRVIVPNTTCGVIHSICSAIYQCHWALMSQQDQKSCIARNGLAPMDDTQEHCPQ